MVRQPDGSFLADARASLEDVTAIVGPEFDVGEAAKEVDTLGGYVATRIGRVPVRGELVPGPGQFEIEVLDADPRRVKKLKIYRSMDRPNGRARPRVATAGTAPRRSRAAAAAGSPHAAIHAETSTAAAARDRKPVEAAPPDAAPSKSAASRDAHPPRPHDRAGVGMAAHPDRICRRRRVSARAAAVRHLAGPVPHLSGAGLAGRRRRRRPPRRRARRPPASGWWFGFGYFLAGLYWVGHAFLVDAKTFGWLLPFAVVGLPAGLAVYTAFGLALARLMWMRGPARMLALAVALTLAEWLRGHLLTGFPWNAFGYALISPLWLAQGAALSASGA